MFQVGTILFKQNQQIRIITYKVFGNFRIRLTKIESVYVRSRLIAKYSLIVSYLSYTTSSKTKIEFRSDSIGGITTQLLENVK